LNDPRWKIRPGKPASEASTPVPSSDPGEPVVPLPPGPAAAMPSAGLVATPPPAQDAALSRALASPPDHFGIPRDMYQQDPALAMHRFVMQQTAESHHMVGGGVIGVGFLDLGVAALLFWRAGVNSDAARDARARGQEVTSDPSGVQYLFGALLGLMAAGSFGYGISELATSQDPSALEAYYRESYGGAPR